MFTIKKHIVDNVADLFLRVSLDTEPSRYFSVLDRIFEEELVIRKTWIGKIERRENKFRIMRAKTGFLQSGASMTEIHGQLTPDEKKIEIKFRPHLLGVTTVIWTLFIFAFIVAKLSNDFVGWSVFSCLLVLQLLLFILDFRKTEEKFFDYIGRVRE